jgi:dipeptidyl aminopeptidase/acylaminoacyl peptidase
MAAVRWHDGAANVWIGAGRAPLRLASDLRPWRLRDFHWGRNGRGLVLVLDRAGTEKRWLAWLDLRSGALTRLTPDHAADAQYVGQLGADKPAVLTAVRHAPSGEFELQAVTPTGAVIAEWQGPGKPVLQWIATDTQALAVCATGSTVEWWHGRLADNSWTAVAEIPAADSRVSRPVAFSRDGRALFATSSVGRDTVALVRLSAPSWTPTVLSAQDGFDITAVLMASDGSGPDLISTTDPGNLQSALTAGAVADLTRLEQVAEGAAAVIVDHNDSHCLAEVCYPVGGPAYVTFGRATKTVSRHLSRYSGLEAVRMQRRDPIGFEARDGRRVTGFLTRPPGRPPWPAVLVIHGGPWSRDDAGMDPWAQVLATAGLCCVQVNFRGSRGFGKEFRNAGDGQWSLAMQDDLVDALQSPAAADVVDLHRIGAMGCGYGGYAALMMATQQAVPVRCVVSASAPTDLLGYVASLMSFGGSAGLGYAARIGHPDRDSDRLFTASPVSRVADITVPVRMFHGRRDARVPVSHAVTFADAMRRGGRDCDLTVYEDEGHRFARPQNLTDFRAQCLAFLLRSLNHALD